MIATARNRRTDHTTRRHRLAHAVKFDTLTTLLDSHRDPAAIGGFTLYTDLTDAQVKELADALAVVKEPLATVSSKIATA